MKNKQRRFKFFVLHKKTIILFLVLVFCISCFAFLPSAFASSPSGIMTIVIDAGHGGIDPGCEGKQQGSNERELNLAYANSLKKYLENYYNVNVVMTRTTTNGLYSSFAKNKKKDDMQKRKDIILNSKADLVISIHMNAYPLTSVRGAQVYYNPECEISKNLATSIQDCLKKDLPHAKNSPGIGDYYILNCTNTPAVIVECGFLSNSEEETLLLSDDYREKVCYSILCGIMKYLS
ncbi:MAG: N-acetylmuramoyl-L-alanine amidase [Firmicutes bacterium]|nr:N-acetylmuramoyl-L-alanine amidase [Bacillota bacterium]MDY3658682.1 N-acetylmuramoyl-L-alanine amidase [Eubacteriales bacterium]